jgi:hypothetical protein
VCCRDLISALLFCRVHIFKNLLRIHLILLSLIVPERVNYHSAFPTTIKQLKIKHRLGRCFPIRSIRVIRISISGFTFHANGRKLLSDTRRILRLIQIGKYSIVIDNVIRGPLMKTEWLPRCDQWPPTSKKKILIFT